MYSCYMRLICLKYFFEINYWCLVIVGDFKVSLGTRENAVHSTPLFVTGRPHVHLRALSTS